MASNLSVVPFLSVFVPYRFIMSGLITDTKKLETMHPLLCTDAII